MTIVVQKYGGSSVADADRIGAVAERVARTRAEGRSVVVVVSAMGDTTDHLLELARRVSPDPSRRELDMLLSAGERISMALLSLALNARGVSAISFTGSQSGIITNDSHTNARILEVRPYRVQDELERGRVVIVAGYQGVSYKKEITTLGRGGSDTTAVALAAALDADCEICSDVDGVFTADPRLVPGARPLAELSYEEMQELAESGAQVLNAQAVEFAKARGIAIFARATAGGGDGTLVRRFEPGAPSRVAGIASQRGLALLGVPGGDLAALTALLDALDAEGAAGRELVFRPDSGAPPSVLLPLENVHDFDGVRARLTSALAGRLEIQQQLGAVSAIGTGITASVGPTRRLLAALAGAGVEARGVSTSSFRISALVPEARLDDAVRTLHAALVEEEGAA